VLIKKITLNNFRQYYGTQSMEFSVKGEQNVTVIHGENGAGKTALLNAFNWVLYGETDLPDSEKLVNNYAIESVPDSRKVEMYIEIEFESKGIEYILRRTHSGIKYGHEVKNTEDYILLKYYNDDEWKKLSNPSVEINRIMPSNLRNYFFFDGERIDNLSKHEDNDEIREAVKTVMDLEIIERGIKHTEDAKKDFQKEWANFADEETKHLLEEQESYKEEKEDLQRKRQQVKQNINMRNEQISDIDQQLSLVKGISEKQEERKRLEEELNKYKQDLKSTQANLQKTVSKQGYLAPTHILFSKVNEKLTSQEYTHKQTYPDLTSNLIHSVLEQEVCICGEELCEKHKEKLHSLLEQVAPYNQYASMNSLKKEMDLVNNSRENFIDNLKDMEKKEYQLKEQIIDTQNKLEEISVDLSNREYEDVQGLEENRRNYQDNVNDYQKQIGVIEHKIEELDQKIKEVTNKIDKQQQIQDQAQLAKKRLETCEKLTSVMQEIYTLKEEEVKTDLQEKIQEVYSNFLRKGFKISLTEEFKLVVHNYYGERVPLSQGERQITSLSFIGAIVDIARNHYNKKASNLINEGGIYPLVMDSPFGALDSDHRQRVAGGIHKLSDQIIVIVSTSQWKGEVEEALRPYIGNQYVLNYHDPRQNNEDAYEYTEIKGW